MLDWLEDQLRISANACGTPRREERSRTTPITATSGRRAPPYNECTINPNGTGTCPITGTTTAACNGMATNIAVDVHQSAADLGYGEDQYLVDMCCGNGNFAQKTCADSGTTSDCGDIGQKCAPCGSPVSAGGSCNVYVGVGYNSGYDSSAPNLLCENRANYGNCYCEMWYDDGYGSCSAYIENAWAGYMDADDCAAQDGWWCDEDAGALEGCALQ